MDIVQGDFKWDFKTGRPVGVVNGQRQSLSSEIADEGQKVLLSDGSEVSWTPPSANPTIPDWSKIKSLARYFHRTGFEPFPAWFYHPSGEQRIFKDREEAFKAGILFRKATFEEKGRYGRDFVWDFEPNSPWSPIPYPDTLTFDPNNPGHGKTVVARPPDPKIAQNELLAELIPTVVAAVTTALKGGGQVNAPANIDPGEWDEFLAFQAFKKTQQALGEGAENETRLRGPHSPNAHEAAMAAIQPDIERAEWETKAKEAGIRIDGRWSLERLRKEVVTALEKRVDEAQEAAAALHDSVVALSRE